MKFIFRPILSEIKDLYSNPISSKRFQDYITKLQGGKKGDLTLPISGFNPMAKDHILDKIEELEKLDAETLMEETITALNLTLEHSNKEEFLVVLNIADDLKGGWTNFYSSDFDSKFKLNAFVNRKFCVPYFWTSESYSRELIRIRTLEYLYRCIYRLNNSQPKTLEEHFQQEVYVAIETNFIGSCPNKKEFEHLEDYFRIHKHTEEHDRIFNFFYGASGSNSLGYKEYGIKEPTGFSYAKYIAKRRSPDQCVAYKKQNPHNILTNR